MTEYVTPDEAQRRTGIDATTIRKWARGGKIPGAYQVGEGKRGIWQIPADALPSLRKHETRGRKPKL